MMKEHECHVKETQGFWKVCQLKAAQDISNVPCIGDTCI